MTLQQGISLELNKAKLGKTLEVLVEGYDEESFLFYGRSRGDSIDVDGKYTLQRRKKLLRAIL